MEDGHLQRDDSTDNERTISLHFASFDSVPSQSGKELYINIIIDAQDDYVRTDHISLDDFEVIDVKQVTNLLEEVFYISWNSILNPILKRKLKILP